MATEKQKITFPPFLRLILVTVQLVAICGVAFSPIGLPAHIHRTWSNFSESKRLGVPPCRECGAPAVPVSYTGGMSSGPHVYMFCPKHIKSATDDMQLFLGHWLTSIISLSLFQIVLPGGFAFLFCQVLWRQLRHQRYIPVQSEELGGAVLMLILLIGSGILSLYA